MPDIERTLTVTGWQSTGGVTLGFRFGRAREEFVDRASDTIRVYLDGEPCSFPIREAFWDKCPEIRGEKITKWFRKYGLAPWPHGKPPVVRLVHMGKNTFRAEGPRR